MPTPPSFQDSEQTLLYKIANKFSTAAEQGQHIHDYTHMIAVGVDGSVIPDAPSDGDTYGRKDGEWSDISLSSISDMSADARTFNAAADFAAMEDLLATTDTRLEKAYALSSTLFAKKILLTGDSIIDNMTAALKARLGNIYGVSGYGIGTLSAVYAGGAELISAAFTTWMSGDYHSVPSGGTVEFNRNGSLSIPGRTCWLYYVVEPGAGTFKVQTSSNGAAYADVSGYTNVSCDGTLAGVAITFQAAAYGSCKIKVTGLTGSVKIIGAAVYDSASSGYETPGVVVHSIAKGGIDMSQSKLTPAAIAEPILASIAPNVVVQSHIDGAAAITADFPDVVELINGGLATLPSWIVIGPPVAQTDSVAAFEAQAKAQRAWCLSNNATWIDQRLLLGGNIADAIARGSMLDADVHPTAVGIAAVVEGLISELSLHSTKFGPYRSIRVGNASLVPALSNANDRTIRLTGSLRLTVDPNDTTNNQGVLALEDLAGPTGLTDVCSLYFQSNTFKILLNGVTLNLGSGSGQGATLTDAASTASVPQGRLGAPAVPWREIHLGKTITTPGTTGAATINMSSGRVNFAAAATSLVVTNSLVTASSIVIATVATNDTTMTSVQAVAGVGSFTLYANVAPTGETAVNFLVTQ